MHTNHAVVSPIASRWRRAVWVWVVVAMAMTGSVLFGSNIAVAEPVPSGIPPSADPFYTYDGELAGTAPGAILRTRPATFAAPGLVTPIVSTQVLYRTTDQQGAPSTTVATVLQPPVPGPGPAKLISYHMAYDALGSECDPSYTLGGNGESRVALVEQAVIAGYVAAGYTVVVPDYEGPDLEWTVGRQSAYAALDGIRAARDMLTLPDTTPVGLIGYSGGSVPTQWGAEVAPQYAPELHIVGAAAGGLPVDLAHNLPYVSGSAQWAGVIPALVVAYRRAYGLDTDAFLSDRGRQLVSEVEDRCIGDFAADYPGLTDADMVRAPYRSLLDVPGVVAAIDDNIMGTSGTPVVPVLLAVGHSDVTGDAVMVTGDVEGLAHTYCSRGVPVTYARYDGLDHGAAFAPFQAQAAEFLTARFSGEPIGSNCSAIGSGNKLDTAVVPGG